MSQPVRNILSKDVEIKGTVIFKHELSTDGKIEGDILSSGTLTIGKTGSVKGDIQAAVVTIHGVVNGNVTVEQLCELGANAQLMGDLDAPRMMIEEGATFVGRAKVQPVDSHRVAPTGQPVRAVAPPKNVVPQSTTEVPSEPVEKDGI